MTSTPLLLRALLTVAFVAAGAFCLRRCVAGGAGVRPATRVDDAWHVVMTGLMVTTLWVVPRFPGWQAAVLGVACGWFTVRAVARPPTATVRAEPVRAEPVRAEPVRAEPVRAEPVRAEPVPAVSMTGAPGLARAHVAGCVEGGHRRGRRVRCAHHAVLMGLSAWMIAGPVLAGGGGRMAGMPMGGGSGSGGVVVWVVAAAYCLGVSGLLLIGWVRGRGELAHVVMAAGMGAMFAAMA